MILLNALSGLLLLVVGAAVIAGKEFGLVFQASAIFATVGYLYLPVTLALMIAFEYLLPSVAQHYYVEEKRTVAIVDTTILASLVAVSVSLWT